MTNKLPQNLLCFSHLRWDFVYQRPQHLMTRFANIAAVYFFEEPIFTSAKEPFLTVSKRYPDIWVCVPHLPEGLTPRQINDELKNLLDFFFTGQDESDFIFWYYTPMSREFSSSYNPALTVYDCMDELSAFKFAPLSITTMEKRLFEAADIVFTGGLSLYESKRTEHYNIHPYPSSIDKMHFATARNRNIEPAEQVSITGPKLGFYGVIDERFDYKLIEDIAFERPDWQIILIGPIVKIDPQLLPKNPNIHYMGAKSYADLPAYLSGWDIALIPFLLNESTKFISPTKTPEYLAAGIPVVSTAIRDVVNPYKKKNLVSIGKDAAEFVEAIDQYLTMHDRASWLSRVDRFLATNSWDNTFNSMIRLMGASVDHKTALSLNSEMKNAS